MNFKMLLRPLAGVFQSLSAFRKWGYRQGYLKRYRAPVPVIVVGNISLGGTGKTPMTEYILALLQNYNCGFLSRGYGRRSKGYREITSQSTPQQVGDEPLQIAQKFPRVKAAVCEKRPQGIQNLLHTYPQLDALILDDAYQHLPLKAHYYLLLTTYERPFFKDYVFPAGYLREGRHAAAEADAIVVTKCPSNMSLQEQRQYKTHIARYSKAPVYFSTLHTTAPTNLHEQPLSVKAPVAALTAIANPLFWLRQIEAHYPVKNRYFFKDHHFFTLKDLQPLLKDLQTDAELQVICTQKDFVKLRRLVPAAYINRFYVQSVAHRFLENSAKNFAAPLLKLLAQV